MDIIKTLRSDGRASKRCEFCNTKYFESPMFKRRKFCSDNCRAKYRYQKLKKAYEDR